MPTRCVDGGAVLVAVNGAQHRVNGRQAGDSRAGDCLWTLEPVWLAFASHRAGKRRTASIAASAFLRLRQTTGDHCCSRGRRLCRAAIARRRCGLRCMPSSRCYLEASLPLLHGVTLRAAAARSRRRLHLILFFMPSFYISSSMSKQCSLPWA